MFDYDFEDSSEGVTCPGVTVINSNMTYTQLVASGGILELPDTAVTLEDSLGNVLSTTDVPSVTGGVAVAGDSTYTVEYENGTPIESGTIPAEGSVVVQVPNPIVCADATYSITDDSANVLYSGSIPSGGNLNQTIQDSTVNINNSAATLLYSLSVNAEGFASQTIADAAAFLKTTAGNTISITNVPAETAVNITAPDTSIEVNGVAEGSVVAGSTLDVRLFNTTPVSVAPLTSTLTGSDLDLELDDVTYDIYVNGVFNTSVSLPYGENNTLNINA
jgi:hypothetical protein